MALDSLGASLRLHGREATLENLEARHAEDFLRAQGTVEPHGRPSLLRASDRGD